MKKYFRGFYLSLGMFTAIPLPAHLWGGDCMRLALPCLPLIGGLIGALWWGAAELFILGEVHLIFTAAVISLIPFVLTGFLHLDGYMDTSDAVLSRRPLEDKRRILKDPHTGAFAVIMLAVLFILQFASVYVVTESAGKLGLLAAVTVISRCCAAWSVLSLSVMQDSGYAKVFSENTGLSHKIFVAALAVLTAALFFLYSGGYGLAVVGAVILGYMCATAYVFREFKGISGDLTGFAIVISELCGLMALAIISG